MGRQPPFLGWQIVEADTHRRIGRAKVQWKSRGGCCGHILTSPVVQTRKQDCGSLGSEEWFPGPGSFFQSAHWTGGGSQKTD